jgi:hypothetical protein
MTAQFLLRSCSLTHLLSSGIKVVCIHLQTSFSFWGTSSPDPTGASPLVPVGGYPSSRSLIIAPPPCKMLKTPLFTHAKLGFDYSFVAIIRITLTPIVHIVSLPSYMAFGKSTSSGFEFSTRSNFTSSIGRRRLIDGYRILVVSYSRLCSRRFRIMPLTSPEECRSARGAVPLTAGTSGHPVDTRSIDTSFSLPDGSDTKNHLPLCEADGWWEWDHHSCKRIVDASYIAVTSWRWFWLARVVSTCCRR